jgi:hypothetical protein
MEVTTLRFYERFKSVPGNAKKIITGGRLKGFTDISPIWRIKTLTEAFGPCGIGWNIRVIDKREVPGANKGEVAVFVDIELTYRETPDGEWSQPIFGTGGSMLVVSEEKGLRLDDEAYKKAYTDAISVACKMLGVGADVYWDKDASKYGASEPAPDDKAPVDGGEVAGHSKTPDAPGDDIEAEIAKMKKLIFDNTRLRGYSESQIRMKAEAYIETRDGVFVKFDDMNLEQLSAVKVKTATLPKITQ